MELSVLAGLAATRGRARARPGARPGPPTPRRSSSTGAAGPATSTWTPARRCRSARSATRASPGSPPSTSRSAPSATTPTPRRSRGSSATSRTGRARWTLHPDVFVQVKRAKDLAEAKRAGRLGLIFGLQDGVAFATDLSRLEVLRNLGVIIIQPTYNFRNLLGDGCLEPGDAGLEPGGPRRDRADERPRHPRGPLALRPPHHGRRRRRRRRSRWPSRTPAAPRSTTIRATRPTRS